MARKRGSIGTWVLVAALIAMFPGIKSCLQGSSSTSKTQPDAQAVSDNADGPTEAHEPGSVWPPLPVDGAPHASDLTASNYYIVLDGSGSMSGSKCASGSTKLRVALSALQRFVGTVPATANLGLAVFDTQELSERVPLGVENRPAFEGALRKVQANGGTPLLSAISLGFEKLTAQATRQLGYGEYHLVVVTDGRPDPESEDPAEAVEVILATSPVVVHTIGFCIGTDHVLNQPGRTLYMAADSPGELEQGLASVLAEAPSFDAASFEKD